ncbi:MAG: YdcF family protein [Clostridiales bacterium]|nr:YdcF family protein [Clostridiales bacterium]
MKQATRQIAALAAALIALFILCRLTFSREYTANVRLYPYGQSSFSPDGARVELDNPQAARLDRVRFGQDRVSFSLHPIKRGETSAQIFDSEGNEVAFLMFRVGALGTVYDLQTGGFTGDNVMLAGTTLFWLLLSAIMLWHYFRAKGSAFYSLASVYYSGFSLFSLITGGLMLRVTFRHLFDPAGFSLYSALDAITRASIRFMTLTMPVMLVFAVALAISNLVLLRHEGYALQNVLGLAVSALLIAGEAAGLYIFTRDFMGSEFAGLVRSTLENSYATVFVYFECMLAGAVICAVTAARYRPKPDKDAIIILGCRFRKDGTLPPLLRGRVDRALKFFSEQKQAAGKQAVFIPSGGQGSDEPMAEAEAMRRYLIDNGIPSESIFPEAGSKNTDQNMAFSKRIVDEVAPNGNVLFVTTNYHVFRSGICAARAGLDAVGIGGKTAWWYWPNAFMREAAGLLVRYWKQDTALLILLIVFFALMSMLL